MQEQKQQSNNRVMFVKKMSSFPNTNHQGEHAVKQYLTKSFQSFSNTGAIRKISPTYTVKL